VVILYALVLCVSKDGDLTPKHVGEFMCMDDLWFNINCVYLLMYVDDCKHDDVCRRFLRLKLTRLEMIHVAVQIC
jgi:hypothetical protein